MNDESVSPLNDWLRPFDQDADDEKQREEDLSGDEEGGAMRPRTRDTSKGPTDKETEEHYMHHSEFRQ